MTDYWVPAHAINHDWFVLRNRHLDPRCTECHTVGFRSGDTPDTCYGCHQPAYEATTMPPHEGFPTDCATCHTDAGWVPSTFNHSWALTGAHARIPCSSCHGGSPPVYAGTPTTCVGCHRAQYDASAYPGHGTFPTTCADCHSTEAWRPALEGSHPESRFPIGGGPHRGYECLDCHNPALGSSARGMNTDCVNCHDGGVHSRARMDSVHREEASGYPFGTTSVNFCLDCHPSGRH